MKKENKTGANLIETSKIPTINIPKAVKDRLMEKMVEKHEDKIIEILQIRAEYVKKIREIDNQIKELTNVYA